MASKKEQPTFAALAVLGESADLASVDDYDDVDCSQSLLSLCSSTENAFTSSPVIKTPKTKIPQIESIPQTSQSLPQIIEKPKLSQKIPQITDNPLSPQINHNVEDIKDNKQVKLEKEGKVNLNITTGLNRVGPCRRCSNIVSYDALAEAYDPPIPVPLPGDSFFTINWCPNCKPDNEEELISIEILPRQWSDIAEITLINLHQNSSEDKKAFIFREEICKFVSKHWDRLCIGKVSFQRIFIFQNR